MKSRKHRFWLTTVLVFFILILSAALTYAQGLNTPCNGGDPDVDCPIDNAVILLACTTTIFVLIKTASQRSHKMCNDQQVI